MKKILATLFFICLFSATNTAYALPTLKITFKVIDENGQPIGNAKVGAGLERSKVGGVGIETTSVRGFTDNNGFFTVKGSGGSYLGFNVTKDGYYKTEGRFRDFTGVSGIYGFRKWEPWNPTIDVVLKKIINPIPMYVAIKTGDVYWVDPPATLPEEGKFYGYDLIAKDWVVPYGQGLHSDFIFKIDVAYYNGRGDYDLSLALKFTNPEDGIQSFYAQNMYSKKGGSALQSPHHAPTDGYKDRLVIRNHQLKDRIYRDFIREDQNYFFRIRTKKDEQGEIIEARYGKIYGDIEFSIPKADEKGEIYFSYYLNPNNNDTNVEFSPEKNLFPKPEGHRGAYRFNP